MSERKVAVIIGAGPAGLTAAFELLKRTDIKPVVVEKSERVGGIATTVNFKGNRIDLGGHRFFSKSDRVMDWWLSMLPLQRLRDGEGPDPDAEDRVMLLRQRRSRIYFAGKLFDYPLRLTGETLWRLGLKRTTRIVFSYARSVIWPIRPEGNLEHFFINRFGRELYETFFKSYTEKVWGVPCHEISVEWGAQRIKGLSVTKAVEDFLKKLFLFEKDVRQKRVETSLIGQFLYPKYGPGQMWEEVAGRVRKEGGIIMNGLTVDKLHVNGSRIVAVEAVDESGRRRRVLKGDYFFSTMPVKDLVRALDVDVPAEVARIAEGLVYRDFITVGLLLRKFNLGGGKGLGRLVNDNWIYVQEPSVKVGRVQIFNNWSPYLVADATKGWVGLEYFCSEGDELWQKSDRDMADLAIGELCDMDMVEREDVIDSVVIRMPKTYPAYWGTYERFGELREYLDKFENLYLIGRNGMHQYNNQDHSMLAAMTAVDNIVAGRVDRSNIWAVNAEREYHEEK